MATVDDFVKEITSELYAYKQDIADDLKKEIIEEGKTCVAELKVTSPKSSGEYAKGWKVKRLHESNDDIRIAVHNSKKYQLTHLLEDGHAKRGGGRVEAHPHIEQAEKNVSERLNKKVKIIIRGKKK